MTAFSPGSAQTARDATRGSVVRLLAEAGSRALSFVTTLLLARGMGVEDFGRLAFLSALAVVAAEVFDLGLHGTAQRCIPARELSLGALLRAKLLLLVVSLAGTLVLALLHPVAALLVLYFAVSGWAELCGVVLRGLGRRGQEALVLLLIRAGTLVAVLVALARQAGLTGIAWAHAVSALPALALGLALLWRVPSTQAEASTPRPLDILRTSWPLAVNGGLALLNLRAELVILRLWSGVTEVAFFAAALRLIETLNGVPSAIAGGAMPALTREALQGGQAARQRTALLAAGIGVPAALGLFWLAPGVATLLFGAEFERAHAPLRVLALALPALFMGQVLLHSLLASGHSSWLPRLTAGRLALAVGFAMLLVPRLGALGAAIGFLASELSLVTLACRAARTASFEVPVLRPLGVGLVASLPMLVALAVAPGGAIVSIATGASVYLVTLGLLFRFAPGLVSSVVEAPEAGRA